MRGHGLIVRGRVQTVRGPGAGPRPTPGSSGGAWIAALTAGCGIPPHWEPSRCAHSMPRSVLPPAPRGPLENAAPSRALPAGNSPGIAAEAADGALGRTRHRASLSWGSFTEQVRGVAEIGPRFSLWRINLALPLLLREVVVACVGDVQTDCCSYPIKISGSF